MTAPITAEQKQEIVAAYIKTHYGRIRLSDAMLGRPQDPYWKVRLRALPYQLRDIRDAAVEIAFTPVIWYMKLRGVPVYTWFERHRRR